MNLADIIKHSDKKKIIIYPLNVTNNAGSIASEPFVFLDDTVSNVELAETLLKVLKKSKLNVERPKDWREFRKNYLKSLKVKTMNELHTNSINVGVIKKNGILELSPTRNMGSRKGFEYSKNMPPIKLSAESTVEEIGEALEEVLSQCR